jgi:hypothetical protein
MMRFIQTTNRAARWAAVAVALTVCSPAAQAQQPSAAAMSTAKEIIAVTGTSALFNPLINGVIEQARLLYLQQDPGLSKDLNEITAKLRNDLAPRLVEVINEVARNYATRFTEQELKDMLAFYKSPLGTKVLSEQPKVVDVSLKFAQTWANGLSDEAVAKMREELKKKGHAF